MISLAAGLPHSSQFPFEELSFRLKDGTAVQLDAGELSEALQYGPSMGSPGLLDYLTQLQVREHAPQGEQGKDWDTIVTAGAQEALHNVVSALLDEQDHVLVENPTYSGALAALRPIGCRVTGVDTDHDGLIPSALQRTLEVARADSSVPTPKVLYTVPTGHNPAGSTIPLERRKDVYALAQEHDLVIVEDDPYWFLHYGRDRAPEDKADFKRAHVPSYWSMDTDGRVVRLDSFSKVVSSGLRLGFASGPAPLIHRMMLHAQASTMHSSSMSQMLVTKLFDTWGLDGWEAHMQDVALFYMRRRDFFCDLLTEHLGDRVTWKPPTAGMFVWLDVHGVDDTSVLLKEHAIKAKVLLMPGRPFRPDDTTCSFVRSCFSTVSPDDAATALQRFAGLLDQHAKP